MHKCLICLLLALCLLGSAVAEGISLPSTCVSTRQGTFDAVFDEESGNTYYLLPGLWGLTFYRYHPQNGWKKLGSVFNGVWDIEYSDGWIFYKKEGGWSGGYSDLHALNVETGEKVYLVKNRCSLLTAVNGEAIIYNDSSEMYERVNPETLARTPVEWTGGFRSQAGDTFMDDAGAWSFRPYGGEAVSLGFTSEQPVYALRPDCWVRNVWDYSQKPYWRLEIWCGGELELTARCDRWLMDDRYVVWYDIEQEKSMTSIGGVTTWHSADEHIKHLYIFDTMGDGNEPLCVEVPVDMRIDCGMSLVNGTAVILTAKKWGHSTLTCIDLATGEMTTLQN